MIDFTQRSFTSSDIKMDIINATWVGLLVNTYVDCFDNTDYVIRVTANHNNAHINTGYHDVNVTHNGKRVFLNQKQFDILFDFMQKAIQDNC